MARITDHNKIERLKQATMKLVVKHGFGGASAALIAKEAQVASGYFYMHYKGKYEMVNTILQEVYYEVFGEFEALINNNEPFLQTIEKLVRYAVGIANAAPIKIKFLYVLTNDYSFVIDQQIRENTLRLIELIRKKGLATNLLDRSLTIDDLYLVLVITTIQYINQKYKFGEKEIISEEDIQHLLKLFIKFLKHN